MSPTSRNPQVLSCCHPVSTCIIGTMCYSAVFRHVFCFALCFRKFCARCFCFRSCNFLAWHVFPFLHSSLSSFLSRFFYSFVICFRSRAVMRFILCTVFVFSASSLDHFAHTTIFVLHFILRPFSHVCFALVSSSLLAVHHLHVNFHMHTVCTFS